MRVSKRNDPCKVLVLGGGPVSTDRLRPFRRQSELKTSIRGVREAAFGDVDLLDGPLVLKTLKLVKVPVLQDAIERLPAALPHVLKELSLSLRSLQNRAEAILDGAALLVGGDVRVTTTTTSSTTFIHDGLVGRGLGIDG